MPTLLAGTYKNFPGGTLKTKRFGGPPPVSDSYTISLHWTNGAASDITRPLSSAQTTPLYEDFASKPAGDIEVKYSGNTVLSAGSAPISGSGNPIRFYVESDGDADMNDGNIVISS